MVRLILCRCIQISAQVSEAVVVPAPLCLKIIAVWSPLADWNTISGDNVTCHQVELQSQTLSQILYYATKVSSSGTICNEISNSSLTFGNPGW